MDFEEIRVGVLHWAKWWIEKRQEKLEKQLSQTMAINPFLMPFIFDYHDLSSLDDWVDLILASHLLNGHNTGFGKLIDEKILPNVFGTQKLDRAFRSTNPPLENSAFNEIDHVLTRPDGKVELLSLKAGKWTIQLSMAMNLNDSFYKILRYYQQYRNIVVGVFYGNSETLTDKYDILRGINRGAEHNVHDITSNVTVHAGNEFWTWLSGGFDRTQEAVMQGITDALVEKDIKAQNRNLLNQFRQILVNQYGEILGKDENYQRWFKLLSEING